MSRHYLPQMQPTNTRRSVQPFVPLGSIELLLYNKSPVIFRRSLSRRKAREKERARIVETLSANIRGTRVCRARRLTDIRAANIAETAVLYITLPVFLHACFAICRDSISPEAQAPSLSL